MKPGLSERDQEMIEAIGQGGSELERVMRSLYQESDLKGKITEFVISMGGTTEDAEDIFQDSIRNLILSVRKEQYKGLGTISGYLYGTARNLWYKRFRKIRRAADWESTAIAEEADHNSPEIVLVDQELEIKINELLDMTGEKCRKVLEMWKLSYSMKEIAEKLGYKNEGVARKTKRLCMKKLLDILDQRPDLEDQLKP